MNRSRNLGLRNWISPVGNRSYPALGYVGYSGAIVSEPQDHGIDRLCRRWQVAPDEVYDWVIELGEIPVANSVILIC